MRKIGSRSPRKFYIIRNFYSDPDDSSDDDNIEESGGLRLCVGSAESTKAHIVGQGVDLIKDSWQEAFKKGEVTLKIASDLKPDIVQTGLTSGPYERLVGLFASTKADKDLIRGVDEKLVESSEPD